MKFARKTPLPMRALVKYIRGYLEPWTPLSKRHEATGKARKGGEGKDRKRRKQANIKGRIGNQQTINKRKGKEGSARQ